MRHGEDEVTAAQLDAVDQALARLPAIDAPQQTVARTLDAVERARGRRGMRMWQVAMGGGAIAAAAALALVTAVSLDHGGPSAADPQVEKAKAQPSDERPKLTASVTESSRYRVGGEGEEGRFRALEPQNGNHRSELSGLALKQPDVTGGRDGQDLAQRLDGGGDGDGVEDGLRRPTEVAAAPEPGGTESEKDKIDLLYAYDLTLRVPPAAPGVLGDYEDRWADGKNKDLNNGAHSVVVTTPGYHPDEAETTVSRGPEADNKNRPEPGDVVTADREKGKAEWFAFEQDLDDVEEKPVDTKSDVAPREAKEQTGEEARAPEPPAVVGWLEVDGRLQPAQGQPEDEAPAFIPAAGYFANTYLPRDPRLSRLRERVAGGLVVGGQRLALETLAVPVDPPLDAPRDRGLALFMASDAAAVDGPTRVTLQIGIAGAERAATRRAPLELALVVDLAGVGSETERQALWSLVDQLAAERQQGDRFTILAAGLAEPLITIGERFERAEVKRALADALTRYEQGAPRGTLVAAADAAYAAIAAAPVRADGEGGEGVMYGASVVILATAAPLPVEVAAELGDRAHTAALRTVHTSVVGVGPRATPDTLGKVALAGEGRRWLSATAVDAREAMGAELAASGRAVARAVRLRVRLAEGVRLYGVLGSYPLNEDAAERVRRHEQAIDQRVAATTGIAADRGEDEDGIQIVIPAFEEGDEHVVLLDVLVPGPGAVAEVQVRYKDLVQLDNAVERAALHIDEGAGRRANPLALQVVESRLAHHVGHALRQAGRDVAADRIDAARAGLARVQARVVRARVDHPELAARSVTGHDLALLDAYARLLADGAAWRGDLTIRAHVAWSLTLAGLVKSPGP